MTEEEGFEQVMNEMVRLITEHPSDENDLECAAGEFNIDGTRHQLTFKLSRKQNNWLEPQEARRISTRYEFPLEDN